MYSKRKDRLKTIEQLLKSNPDGNNVGDLSARFGVSKRMIFRDISKLRSDGLPIVGVRGQGGGISLEKPGSPMPSVRTHAREPVEIFGYLEERLRLKELLTAASDGISSTAIILGEMGTGKSFIVRDLIAHAERSGFSVLMGNSLERDDSPPYWPWSSILEDLGNIRVPRAASTLFNRSVGVLEQAFPIVSRSKRVRASLLDTLSGNDHLQIQEACRLVLETAAAVRPILIVVEDIQWADKRSLELIQHLMQSIESVPVLMIMTVRTPVDESTDATTSSLAKVLASSRGTAITLNVLKKHEAAQIMRSVSGRVPPDSAVTAAYELSGGNPFFMREISLLLSHRYNLDSIEPDQLLDIPVSVKLAIQERLNIVDKDVIPALQLASVLGRDVDQQELTTACELLSFAEPSRAAERAMNSGILGTNERTGQLWFTHKLIRQTIYESIEPSQLPAYHSAVAKSIEQQSGDRANQQLSDLSRHYWISRSIDGLAKYAHYGVLMAFEQMAALAPKDVQSQFESILNIPDGEIEPQDRALAMFGLGKCRWLQSAGNASPSRTGSTEHYVNAFDAFLELGDEESALMVAADLYFDFHDTKSISLLERADQIAKRDTRVSGRIKLNIAINNYFNSQENDASDSPTLKTLSRILHLARRIQDTELEKEILSQDSRIRIDLLDLEAGLDRSLHQLALTVTQGQFSDLFYPSFQISRSYASLGDLALARTYAPALSTISTSIEHNVLMSQFHAINWSLAICAGDWESARSVIPGMRQWAEDSQITEGSVANSIRILETYLDSMTSLESELDKSWYSLIELSSLPLPSTTDPAQIKAVIALRAGDSLPMELAKKGLLLPPETNLTGAVRHMGPFFRLARNCALGIYASSNGDVDSATRLYQQLLPHKGIVGGVLSAPLLVDRVLGLLAGVLGQEQASTEHFVEAAATAENGGFRPEHAQILFNHAQVLIAYPDSSGEETAYSFLEKSKEIAIEIQMKALVADCEAALSALETPNSSSGLVRFGLTSREEDVLKLIAEGLRNQEIAEQLFISINTVQHHVRNILRKTGAQNRTSASALMAVN